MSADVPWNVISFAAFFGLALGCISTSFWQAVCHHRMAFWMYVNFAHRTFAMLGAYAVFCCGSLWAAFRRNCEPDRYRGFDRSTHGLLLLKPLYGKDLPLPLLLTFGTFSIADRQTR